MYQTVDGAPRDHVVTDRKGHYIRVVRGANDFVLTDDLAKAQRFPKVEVLINDLATRSNGFYTIREDDPRLSNGWPL